MTIKTPIALTLAGLALLAGCAEEDAPVLGPETEPISEIFDRYVALGNSITAGYQSGGINDSTQLLAYPVLLAAQADAEFTVPLFARPGCPPPLAAPFSAARVPPALPAGQSCATRIPAGSLVQNLAVPGAAIGSTSDLNVSASALTTFILGGRTPIDRMLEQDPTLVTAWVGNNDVLGAVLAGSTAALTPQATFEAELNELVTAIQQTPAGASDAVVLIGVVDPRVIPAVQPGLFAFVASLDPAAAAALGKPVSANCGPGSPGSQNFVSLQVISSPGVTTISCADDAPFVSTPADLAVISARAAAFNAAIQARATQNGWIYVNPNDLLLPFLTNPAALRKCQLYATLTPTSTPQQVQAATVGSCPLPGIGFGTLISFDGFHPSSLAHRLVANAVIGALNAKFSLDIEPLGT